MEKVAPGSRGASTTPDVESLHSPGGLATTGFAFIAVALVVLALPAAQGLALVPAILLYLVGVVLLSFADGPSSARRAALLIGVYVVLLFVLFLAATPITLGKARLYVNPEPPAFAGVAFQLVVQALPAALVAGAGAALWSWSGRIGRAFVVAAGVALALFLAAFAWAPGDFEEAESQGRVALAALSLASGLLVPAVALVLFRERLPDDLA